MKHESHHLAELLEQWVEEYSDRLYRYALARVHDKQLAEDIVQETFISALQSYERFEGRSSPLTWLYGILKHKLIDVIRREARYSDEDASSSLTHLSEEEFFNKTGMWNNPPRKWGLHPEEIMENQEIMNVLQDCLETLPQRYALIFSLREFEDLSTDEICKILNVTPTNVWVLLHRARLKLRSCIEKMFLNPHHKETTPE